MHAFFQQFSKVGNFFESTFIAGFAGEVDFFPSGFGNYSNLKNQFHDSKYHFLEKNLFYGQNRDFQNF